jgi:hypothetical protein
LDRERMIAELRDQRVRVNARLEYRLDIHEPATIRRISLDRMDSPG